jgi:hypothetical protein
LKAFVGEAINRYKAWAQKIADEHVNNWKKENESKFRGNELQMRGHFAATIPKAMGKVEKAAVWMVSLFFFKNLSENPAINYFNLLDMGIRGRTKSLFQFSNQIDR